MLELHYAPVVQRLEQLSYTQHVGGPSPPGRTKKIFDIKILVQQKITQFSDLEVWKQSHKLTLLVYKSTLTFPKDEVYGLTSQVKRAVVSIESCIAEGFARFHYKDRPFIMVQEVLLQKFKLK